MSNEEIEDILRSARAYCAEKLPWFSPALFACKIHLTPKIPIAGIDKNLNVYWNPKAVEKICATSQEKGGLGRALSEIGFLWIHEITHVLREHASRAKEINADAETWNIATDLEINDGDWAGLNMPTAFPGLLPAKYNFPNGQIAEYYFKKLIEKKEQEKKEQQQEQQKQQQQQSEKGEKDGKPSKGQDNGNEPKDQENKKGQNGAGEEDQNQDFSDVDKIKNGDVKWDEGSGVHDHAREWEMDKDGTEPKPELDEMELERIRRSVAKEMEAGKPPGKLPGGWDRWIDEKLKPKVDWRKILRKRMSVAIATGVGGRIDYSFARPSRRQSVYNPIMPPSLSGDLSARIACVIDTSGSMTVAQLAQAISEVCKVLEIFKIPVTIIPCDAKAYDPIKVEKLSDYFKLKKLEGGGGTNMVVGIDAALELKPKPDSVLVLTDGYTPYPRTTYKTPVIFGIFKMPNQNKIPKPPNPPWKDGTVVEIEING